MRILPAHLNPPRIYNGAKATGKHFIERRRNSAMENRIEWVRKMEEAIKRGRSENKPILLDFFNPG